MPWAKCKTVLRYCVGSTNCSMGRPSFPFVGLHRRYNSPSFLKKPTPLSAGCSSAASRTPFNVLSVSCNVFYVSLFMFNTISYDPTCGGLTVLCALYLLFSPFVSLVFSFPPSKILIANDHSKFCDII